MNCPKCQAEDYRSFTFSTGEKITLCPTCQYEEGHKILNQGILDKPNQCMVEFWELVLSRYGLTINAGRLPEDRISCVGSTADLVILSDTHQKRPFSYSLSEKVNERRVPLKSTFSDQKEYRKWLKKQHEKTVRLFASFGWDVHPGPGYKARYVGRDLTLCSVPVY